MRPLLKDTLKMLREAKKCSQAEVADWLSHHYKPTKARAVSDWELGNGMPSGEYLLYLIEFYNVIDALDVFWDRPRLNADGYMRLQEYARLLGESPRYAAEKPRQGVRVLRHYLQPVSAGRGNFLDGDDYVEREVGDNVPADATYAVPISGDSMMPRFVDTQWIFVKEQDVLEPGEIGIFLYDGEAYCKVLGHSGKFPALVSLNEAYEPLPVRMPDELRVLGKVVG